MARAGHIIRFICSEEQVIKLLREITYNDGVITSREVRPDGIYITVRKT